MDEEKKELEINEENKIDVIKEKQESTKNEYENEMSEEEEKKEESDNKNYKTVEVITKKNNKKKKVIICVLIFCFVLIILSTIFAILNMQNTKIINGIYINGVNISGLTNKKYFSNRCCNIA